MSGIYPYSFLIGFEDTAGETPANPTPFKACIQEDGIKFKQKYGKEGECFGDIDQNGKKPVTGYDLDGNLQGTLYWEQLPIYLKLILGNATDTDNGDGTYKHEFDTTKDIVTAYSETIVGKNDDLIRQVNGIVGKKFSFSIKRNTDVDFSVDVVASKYKDNKKDTGVTKIDTTNAITLGKTNVEYKAVNLELNGVANCNFASVDIDFDNEELIEELLCQDDNKSIEVTKRKVTGKISAMWDANLYTKIAKNETLSLKITVTNGTNILVIDIPELQVDFDNGVVKVKEKYKIDLPFTAFKETGAYLAKVTVTNSVTAY